MYLSHNCMDSTKLSLWSVGLIQPGMIVLRYDGKLIFHSNIHNSKHDAESILN